MSECDQFQAGSRQRDACEGRCYSLEKTNKFRAHHGIEPISDVVWAARNSGVSSQTIRYIPTTAIASSPAFGHGGRSCCGGGDAPVKPKSFLKKMAERSANLVSASIDFLQDGMERATNYQQQHRRVVCSECPLNENGWCDPTLARGGCGCNIELKVIARAARCPQGKWFAYHDTYQPPVNPTRSMLFHVYPKVGAEWCWHWHLEQIRKHAALFNGRIVIGIVTGRDLASPDEVQRLLDGVPVTDWVIKPNNTTLGETATFRDMLQCVKSDDPNTITFRGHTKGASHPRGSFRMEWARLMWDVCMDAASVEDALSSHITAGPMKSHEPLVKGKRHQWFYAGSFYWFRNAPVFAREWDREEPLRWWSEAWPSSVAEKHEAASLCHDHTAGAAFGEQHFRSSIVTSFNKWQEARVSRDRTLAAESQPHVTLITPTGDRPESFALCERWMSRQTFTGPVQWIVVDDGAIPTRCTMGQEYIRRQPGDNEGHTLTRNLRMALPLVRAEKILIIEDDEWYAPNYIEQMATWLNESPLVGAGVARYYWPREARYRELSDHVHASLCRTGFRVSLIPQFAKCISTNDPSVDMRLWEATSGVRHDDGLPLVIGFKGMPGRLSGGGKPSSGKSDDSLAVLRSWIGDDVEHYRPVLPNIVDSQRASREKIIVYTVVLNGYDSIRPPTVINPDVTYIAITDGDAPAPWQIVRPPARVAKSVKHESRRLKIMAHELFSDADWTIYVDGQLQLAVDPLELLAECEAWGRSALYVFNHQDRDCIYAEIDAIGRVRRDMPQNMASQKTRYITAGVKPRSGLYLGGILIRRGGGACDNFNAAWWSEVSNGSHRDQISMPVAIEQSGVNFTAMPANWWKHFVVRHPHVGSRR